MLTVNDLLDDEQLALHEGLLNIPSFRRARLQLKPGQRPLLLFIHGLSASPAELDPLPENLAQAGHMHLLKMRLCGHGIDGQALASARVDDWLDDVHRALSAAHRLSDSVWVLVSSTGLPLTLSVLHENPYPIKGLIALSPNLGPANPLWPLLAWPFAKVWLPRVYGHWQRDELPASAHSAWTSPYPVTVLTQMAKAVRQAQRLDKSRLEHPLLWFAHYQDPTINAAAAVHYWQSLPSGHKTFVWLSPPSDGHGHVLAGTACNPFLTPRIQQHILNFMQLELCRQIT